MSYCTIERFFLGVALQHSENLNDQNLGIQIANSITLAESPIETQATTSPLVFFFRGLKGYPHEHAEVFIRFGRFPGRNGALVCCTILRLFLFSD